ncbi:MAG: hypothetical protein ABEI97_04375, partial [Candidatus Nanohaloarchaea archaeon]
MFDRLKARFTDPVTVEAETADDWFQEERADDIDAAYSTAEAITDEVTEALDLLDDRLAGLEGYEDMEGRDVVEDVTDNIVAERRRMIDEFDTGGDPAALYDALDDFCDRFREMKRKETEVLKVVGEEKDPVFDALAQVEDARDRLSQFLDG